MRRWNLKNLFFLDANVPGRDTMKGPYSVFLELTNNCNAHCLHCRENSGDSLQDELSTEEIKTVLDECLINGTKFIILTGGEPLLRTDVFEILKYSSQIGLKTLLATNGTLLNERKVEFLSKLLCAGITRQLLQYYLQKNTLTH